MKFAHEKYKK